MKKILITGATGDVGKSLCDILSNLGYDILTSARNLPEGWNYTFKTLDITDLKAFTESLNGVSVLVHLAGQREPDAGFEELVGPNIRGAYHAFEAALRAGVQRVVFASSVNASNGSMQKQPISDEVVNPSSFYGASKIFGEALARYYSEKHGLSCICLRMGWTLPVEEAKKQLSDPPMDSLFARKVFLSAEDFAQLVQLVVEAPEDLKFGIFNALSDNRQKILDISKARSVLGYEPKHDSFEILES
jgi:nucleoside-diphosphate-sugar epimerase